MDRKPDIALLVPNLTYGGAQLSAVRLASEFARRSIAVDLVVSKGRAGPLTAMVDAGVHVVELGCWRKELAAWAFARYVRRVRPGVIMSTPTVSSVVALLARRLVPRPPPLVIREAGCLCAEYAHARRRVLSTYRWTLFAVPRLYPAAERFIAISDGVAADLVAFAGVPAERITVIYNAVLPDGPLSFAPVPHPWFAPGEPPVVVSVGRLDSSKGFDVLLRALAAVRRQVPCRLMILGDGPERARLAALTAELGLDASVAFPGFVANPMDYMHAAAAFALATRREGFGNVLVEAMAAGVPVVCANCPGGPREILAEGKFGRLVPIDDPATLAAAIGEALLRPWDVQQSRARADDFRIGRIADQYLGVLRQSGGAPASR